MELKKIGIDCRFWGVSHAGLGRYTRELTLAIIENLFKTTSKRQTYLFELTLFFQKNQAEKNKDLLKKCKIVEVNIPHYSLKEQLAFSQIIDKQNLDLIHFPHFNFPMSIKTPFVVTIHDLIKHYFRGRSVTTRLLPIYWLKHLGYRLVIHQAIKRSVFILCPSYFVKNQIKLHYPQFANKVKVIYEGASNNFKVQNSNLKVRNLEIFKKYKIRKPYFIYVGSAYPFKNLFVLLQAFRQLVNRKEVKVKPRLLIASARDVFWKRLKEQVLSLNLEKQVILPGEVTDDDLNRLYQQAEAFITPSLMEGFGLPGLEAMASGCPVIAAKAGSLPEVYGKAAFFFQPRRIDDLVKQMEKILNFSNLQRQQQIKKGLLQAEKYSWAKAAEETLKIYKQALETFNH